MNEEPVHAPGWDAIDRWVSSKFPAQTPHQFTSRTPYELDAPSPLPAITVWSTLAPVGWLYVSYGLSELFDKTSDDPAISGFGFELTLRVPPGSSATPPTWPLRLIQSLGRHVLTTRKGFDSGHAMDLGGPLVAPGTDGPANSNLSGLICVPDPSLGKVDTVHGTLLFLRLVGVTATELAELGELELAPLVACLAELEPMAVTDPARRPWAQSEDKARILRRYKLGIAL